MKKLLLTIVSIVLVCLPAAANAQKEYANSIKSTVIDKQTNKPIPGAVLYLSHTCYYSIADASGNCEIKNIIPGSYQPVVVAKNYLPQLGMLYIDKEGHNVFSGSMDPLPAGQLAEFNAPKSSDFSSDYAKFERIIIGQTAYMGSCKVENPEVMNLKWSKEVLEGNSNGPIVFVHKKFGYKINCTINNFYYDTKQLTRGLDYTVYFQEMTPKDKGEKEEWEDYRKEAYSGSINHFLWALRNERIAQEDYELFSMRSIGNEAMMSDGMNEASNASSQFQNKILNFSEISMGNLDENQIMFTISGFLKVVHKPRSYSKETSFIQVPSAATLTLDKEGWTDVVMPFTCFGLWGKNGISNLLPKEYRLKK